MKKFIKQLSTTTLALLLFSSSVNLDVYANDFNYQVNTIEDSGTDNTPDSPILTTNFDNIQRTYGLNDTVTEPLEVSANVSDGGTISFQWYKDELKISNATYPSYIPETKVPGTSTYYCVVTNTLNNVTTEKTSNSVSIEVLQGSLDNNNESVDTPAIYEQYATHINYELNRPPSELTLQINASRIESDSINFKWYKSSINDVTTGEIVHSGTLSPYSITNVSVTPDTSVNGTSYYYCVVTNTKNGKSSSIVSNVCGITVNNYYDNYYYDDNYYHLENNGSIHLGNFDTISVNRNSLETYLSRGGNRINIYGSNIQNVNVPPTSYNISPYYVNIHDSFSGLNYSWKINDPTNVTSYIDLVVNTATSLSTVNKSYTNLNYDPHYSQVIKFNHSGSLNTTGTTMLLEMPTTVKNGTVWLYKLAGSTILANTEMQANVSNGRLYANMQSCSDWLISANKLIDVTVENVNPYYYNIKTDARLSIPQFQNVVIGGYLNLSTINTNFFNDYRFEGWYYDTAYQYPITGNALTNMLITADVINNGIYPKFTYYNAHVPEESFPVPGTSVNHLARLF